MNTRVMLNKLSRSFPKKYAKMYHDYVGLMAGKLPLKVNKILLCLDFDEEVFPVALEYKPDLILTHHPFIYGTRAYVLRNDENKKKLYNDVIKNGLCVYSMHTNFDTGKGGMNDALANELELKNIYAPQDEIMMRIGELESEMEVHEFSKYAKEKFNVTYSLLINEGTKTIKKVAIIGGGGSRDYKVALKEGADIYISGDVSHHTRREIIADKFNYLDMPHEIEKIFMPTMKKILSDMDEELDILIVDHEKEPEVI